MSEMEYITGTLTKVVSNDGQKTLEQTAERLISEKGLVVDSEYYDSAVEFLREEFYDKYVIVGDEIFKVDIINDDPYCDIFYAEKKSDGNISFTVKYYNGGCSFPEAIEYAIEGMNKKGENS